MPKNKPKNYRSRNAIKQALITLLQTMPYESISTKQIIDCSTYSRGTFYAHFTDKEDLVRQILLDEIGFYLECITFFLEDIPQGCPVSEMGTQIYSGYERMFQHVYENRELFRCIARKKFPNVSLRTMARKAYEETLKIHQVSAIDEGSVMNMDLNIYLFAYSCFQVIEYWDEHDYMQSPQYITTQMILINGRKERLSLQPK